MSDKKVQKTEEKIIRLEETGHVKGKGRKEEGKKYGRKMATSSERSTVYHPNSFHIISDPDSHCQSNANPYGFASRSPYHKV